MPQSVCLSQSAWNVCLNLFISFQCSMYNFSPMLMLFHKTSCPERWTNLTPWLPCIYIWIFTHSGKSKTRNMHRDTMGVPTAHVNCTQMEIWYQLKPWTPLQTCEMQHFNWMDGSLRIMFKAQGIWHFHRSAITWWWWYTLRKKVLQSTFFVLQVVTNRGLHSVPGRTK